MRQVISRVALACALALGAMGLAAAAGAQDTVWLQIEAQPNLAQARQRARAYAGAFGNVSGFALRSGWYAIVLGPYGANEAPAALDGLRRDRLVPADSFVSDGSTFQRQFWPVGAAAATPAPAPQPAPQLAQQPAPVAAAMAPDAAAQPAPTPPETPAQARRNEAQLTSDEREEVQTALQWDGVYAAAIDGDFGPGTRRAMADWQAGQGYETTGILTTRQRAELVGLYRKEQAALGLQTVRDEEAGIEITLPTALIGPAQYQPPFARYGSKGDSGVQVLLISEPGDSAALGGLYHILQTLAIVPIRGERTLSDRSFVLTGQDDTVQSYTYAALSGGLIKGYTLVWKPGSDTQMTRVLDAMKASFRPFGDQALDPALVPVPAAQRRDLLAGLEVREPVVSRSGFFVDGAGTVVTTTDVLKSCARITVGTDQEVTLAYRDDATGLAVLTPKMALVPVGYARFETAPPRLASEVAVAGYSYGGALDAPAMTFGALADLTGLGGEASLRRLTMTTLPGDAGGPVFDASGAVLGMLLPRTESGGRQLPADTSFAADPAVIAAALSAAGVTATPAEGGASMAPEDFSAMGADMTVLVSCWN